MLLCRLAENAYWLGRYLERAEDLARAILAYEQIRLDLPGQRAPGWQRLAALAGVDEAAALAPTAFVGQVILDRENSSSLLGSLHAARENLRRARSQFPAECWHTLNRLYLGLGVLDAGAPATELRAHLEQVVGSSRELGGQVTAGMLRDEAYAFLRIGAHLERADMMLRVALIVSETLIPSAQGHGTPFENIRWMGLLKSVGAYGTYRHRYHAATDFKSALDLLLREPTFPRSLAHGLQEIGRELAGLPRNADALAALEACRAVQEVETRAELGSFADAALERLAHASSVLQTTYFSMPLSPPEPAPASRPHPRRAGTAGEDRDEARGAAATGT